jgi:CBS domain-containing protein
MKFDEVIDKIGNIPYLAISGECALEEASEKIIQMPQVRGIYVVDEKERLQGYLSLGVLIRHVIAARHKPHVHVRTLLTMITAEKVADIMEKDVICAQKYDMLETVLDKMVLRNIKQVPVVNEDRQIIANVGVLDLWKLIEK